MNPKRLNPAEQTVSESDYKKKFDHEKQRPDSDTEKLKNQEASGGNSDWKSNTKKQVSGPEKKGRFQFFGRQGGRLHKGSALSFVVVLLLGGVWYTSVLAPNILLVNIKEMYTNDLADATIALDAYAKKMMNYKIGFSQCGEKDSIKCKLSTMSRAQKKAFEKHGFTVLGTKVEEDNLDDDQPENDKPESRYQVTALIPPLNATPVPIVTGDMLYLYSKLSDANKALVYGVFNPKSSFFTDLRYKQRIKAKYGMTKSVTIGGTSEKSVNKSFDSSVNNSAGGIDPLSARPDSSSGVSLGSLSNPVTVANLNAAALAITTNSYSYTGLECGWYSIGKAVSNAAQQAKAATVARFAMQYLKQADAIKAGQATEMPTNVLSSKLAQTAFGGYGGPNATDSSMYKSIVYGNLPIPSVYGLIYYLYAYEIIAALTPSWAALMASATALAGVTQAPGSLVMPPANLGNTDRDYCLSGEALDNQTEIRGESTESTRCAEAVLAMAPLGTQSVLGEVAELARRTCPPVNASDDNLARVLLGDWRGPVSNTMLPSTKATQLIATPVIASLFGANLTAWANAESKLFNSNTKGVPASDALFAGTGEILGDMAMSRGMTPGNVATMGIYLAQKNEVEKDYEDIARYNARKRPFDMYNKYSFVGSIARSLSPVSSQGTPLFGTFANVFSVVGSGIKQLTKSTSAIYYLQPAPFNPLRLTCIDPEYLVIGITADTACNVRYQMGKQELAAQIDTVIDYMTKEHPDLTNDNISELEQRRDKADPQGDTENITRMLETARTASNKPQIDEKTGKATPGSEYEKYLDYCVNRQDPWGRSAIALHRNELPEEEKKIRFDEKTGDLEALSTDDHGDPFQQLPNTPYASIVEGAKADQDWYTGKKCLEQSEELTNFRAYTMACSVDGSMSGGLDCTDMDRSLSAAYSDSFYLNNDILYTSWY